MSLSLTRLIYLAGLSKEPRFRRDVHVTVALSIKPLRTLTLAYLLRNKTENKLMVYYPVKLGTLFVTNQIRS